MNRMSFISSRHDQKNSDEHEGEGQDCAWKSREVLLKISKSNLYHIDNVTWAILHLVYHFWLVFLTYFHFENGKFKFKKSCQKLYPSLRYKRLVFIPFFGTPCRYVSKTLLLVYISESLYITLTFDIRTWKLHFL